jgi:outer membrane receptor protein involved in Fe transport
VTYGYVDTEVVTNQSTSQQFQPGQPLLRRPRHAGTLRAAYVAGRATVNFDVRFVGDRFDNSFLSLRTVANAERPTPITADITINPGYTVAGFGVDVRADRSLTVYLRANNITDTKYRQRAWVSWAYHGLLSWARVLRWGETARARYFRHA